MAVREPAPEPRSPRRIGHCNVKVNIFLTTEDTEGTR